MHKLVAAIVGLSVVGGGLAAGGAIVTFGPPGIQTVALALAFGGGIAGMGLLFVYVAFTREGQEGDAGIKVGGPRL